MPVDILDIAQRQNLITRFQTHNSTLTVNSFSERCEASTEADCSHTCTRTYHAGKLGRCKVLQKKYLTSLMLDSEHFFVIFPVLSAPSEIMEFCYMKEGSYKL